MQPNFTSNIQPPSSSQASTSSMCSFTLSSETQISLGLNASRNEFRNAWILDSDATNYMTHNPNHFETYSLCPSNRKIVVVDGTTTTVTGIGDIQVTPNLVIKNVLTQDLTCRVIFYASFCEFQDQHLGRKIGLANEHNGLYYLSTSSQPELFKSTLFTSFFSSSNNDVIWVHHRHLGHVSFHIDNNVSYLIQGTKYSIFSL